MAKINYIGVHHFAGNLTLKQVNDEHHNRWPELPSELRPDLWVGYNFIVWKDGTWTQCRFIGEETAAQKGHNFDTVSICLAGNFTRGIELPTDAQKTALKWLILSVIGGNPGGLGLAVKAGTTVDVKPENILPHRVLQPNHTECYGNALTDDWAQKVAFPISAPVTPPVHITNPASPQSVPNGEEITRIRQLIARLMRQLSFMQSQRLGGISGFLPCLHADVRG